MTPENEKILMDEIQEIRDELKVLRVRITGDPLGNPPIVGVLDFLQTHKNELYGNAATQDKGLKQKVISDDERITKLEDGRNKIYWTAVGISMGASAVWWFIEKFVLK